MKKSVLLFVSRRLVGLMTVLSFIFLFISCSESDTASDATSSKSSYKCPTCKADPEALPQNDNSNKGIYFGILKEGTIFIDIDNQDRGLIFARLSNSTDSALNLESNSYGEEGYVAVFSGLINHVPASFVFRVATDGSNPTINFLDSSGKKEATASFVYKEKSNAMVEVFQGTMMRRFVTYPQVELPDKPDHEIGSPVNYELVGDVTYLFSRATSEWSVLKIKSDNSVETNRGTISGTKLLDENNRNAGTLISDQVNQTVNLHENGKLIIEALRVL